MRWRLSVFVLALILWGSGWVKAASFVPVAIVTEPVQINEVRVDSLLNRYPLLLYKDVTYLPLTWDMCRFMGLSCEWSAERGLQLHRKNISAPYHATRDRLNQPLYFYEAEVIQCEISLNGRLLAAEPDYPWLRFRDVIYMPLTWSTAVTQLGWQLDWDAETGLSLLQRREADIRNTLLTLLSERLFNEYRFYADYQDQNERLWLQGEAQPLFRSLLGREAEDFTLLIHSDTCFWYQDKELFSSFSWDMPLELNRAATYRQSGGALPYYVDDSSFASHPLAQLPLLLFNELASLQGERWQTISEHSFRLELRQQGAQGLQYLEVQLSEAGDDITALLLKGIWKDPAGIEREYHLSVTFEGIPDTQILSLTAEAGAQFLQPLPLADGGMVLLTLDGQVARLNRLGKILWQFTAEPQLYGRQVDDAGNLYIWSYQNLWCLDRYGRVQWQRALGVQSLSIQGNRLLISQRLGERMQWEILDAASGARVFLFPDGFKQAVWFQGVALALSDMELCSFTSDGALLWERSLPAMNREHREELFFDLQYSLLAAGHNWIVVHQQGLQSNKLLCYDGNGALRGEIEDLSSSCQVEPFPYGVYLLNAGTLYWWSPDSGLLQLQRYVSGAPIYFDDGSSAVLTTQYAPYAFVRLISEENWIMWEHQLAWASRYGGPLPLGNDGVVALAARTLTGYNRAGGILWRTLLMDFQEMPQLILTTKREQVVLWNTKEVAVVDNQGRLRYLYRLS